MSFETVHIYDSSSLHLWGLFYLLRKSSPGEQMQLTKSSVRGGKINTKSTMINAIWQFFHINHIPVLWSMQSRKVYTYKMCNWEHCFSLLQAGEVVGGRAARNYKSVESSGWRNVDFLVPKLDVHWKRQSQGDSCENMPFIQTWNSCFSKYSSVAGLKLKSSCITDTQGYCWLAITPSLLSRKLSQEDQSAPKEGCPLALHRDTIEWPSG